MTRRTKHPPMITDDGLKEVILAILPLACDTPGMVNIERALSILASVAAAIIAADARQTGDDPEDCVGPFEAAVRQGIREALKHG